MSKFRKMLRVPFEMRLTGAACVLIALTWSLLALDLWREHARSEAAARQQAAVIAHAMDERVARTLRLADQMLRLIAEDLQARNSWSDARAVTHLLRRFDPKFDDILTISFVNAQGVFIGQSNPAVSAGFSHVDRDYFRAHLASPDLGLFVEQPLFGSVSGQRLFTVSRRVSAADGAFLGVLAASIQTDALAADFDGVAIGKKGAVNLFHLPSQRVIVRQPDHPGVFATILPYQDLQRALAQAPRGVFLGDASLDGEARIFAYRRIADLPLVVSVGLATSDLRNALLRQFAGNLMMALLLSVIIVGGAFFILAAFRRELALRESKRIATNFFQQTFDAAPVGMAVADVAGCYIKVNRAMCEFTGYAESELLGRSYRDITHPDDIERNVEARESLLNGKYPSFEMEKRFVRKDGRAVWALMVASLVRDAGGQPLYSIGQMRDIDAQKRGEKALRISEQRFRSISENANIGIAATEKGGRAVYCNEAFCAMLGYEAEALKAMNFADFTFAEDLVREAVLFEEVLHHQRDKYRLEKRYVTRDGRIIWVDISVSTIRDDSGEIINFVGVANDITERKASAQALTDSRQQLRALAAHQEERLEGERKHIAREVHDDLGQLLTALKMNVSLLRLRFGENNALLDRAEEMRLLVDQTIHVVRQVASNLRPAALDLGLLPAIEWLADDFSARWSIRCRLDVGDGDILLDELQSSAVFRVVQESLTNVARYAGAGEVTISLHVSGQCLHLSVKDDGVGFDTVAIGKARGFGLFGMRERMLAAGGTLRIESIPGKGTTVSIELPFLNGESP